VQRGHWQAEPRICCRENRVVEHLPIADETSPSPHGRRRFLHAAACTAGMLAAGRSVAGAATQAARQPVLPPTSDGRARRIALDTGVTLNYVREGNGPPLLLIPGWTCTWQFFKHQIAFFSRTHEVIAYDPRGQGQSSRPLDGNNFAQRGRDLAAFLQALKLDQVRMVGWSYGAYDMLAYVREFGLAQVDRLVILDEPPKSPVEAPGQWGELDIGVARKDFMRPLLDDRLAFWTSYVRYMIGAGAEQTLATNPALRWLVEEGMHTPDYACLPIILDGIWSDFSEVAAHAARERPTLVMARADWAAAAHAWVQTQMPAANFARISLHMAFWTEPEVFNPLLQRFLASGAIQR
jgi:non-heme chloroperoxidase